MNQTYRDEVTARPALHGLHRLKTETKPMCPPTHQDIQQKDNLSLVFVAGILARSGTNYLARLLLAHPDVCRPTGHWELPLLDVADRFAQFHAAFLGRRKPNRLDYSLDEFGRCFGHGLMHLLAERVPSSKGSAKYLLHKNPSTQGIDHFRRFFPKAKLIFLVRDGRDNVNSLLTAAGHGNGRWWSVNRFRYFCMYVWEWKDSARRIINYLASRHADCMLVKFEDLHVEPEKILRRIAEHVGLTVNEEWLQTASNTPVVGSGFYRASENSSKESPGETCWQEVPRTSRFRPIGRWKGSWSILEKQFFLKIAGCELRALGYDMADITQK